MSSPSQSGRWFLARVRRKLGHFIQKKFKNWLETTSLLRHFLWKYWRLSVVGLLALLLVDVLEVVPPLLLKKAVDLVSLVGSIGGAPIGTAASVGNTEAPSQFYESLLLIALAYLSVALLQGLGRYGWRMFLIRSSLFAGRDLRTQYAKHLFSLSANFFDTRRIGDLMSLATNDTEAVRMALGAGLLTLADAFFYFLTIPVAMFLLSPRLTILSFIPLIFLPRFVAWGEREIHARFKKVQDAFSSLSAIAQENLNGIRVTKAFACENDRLNQFQEAGEEFIRLNLHLSRVQSLFGPILDFSMSLGLVVLLYVGGRGVVEDSVTIGTFVAFQRYIQKMVWPMASLGHAMALYQRALASSGRLKEVLAVQSNVPESHEPVVPAQVARTKKCSGAIVFSKLSFSYPDSSSRILDEITLQIEPGERVAFVGTIGAGKSALLSLLPRLYPVERNMLFIDGVDLNDWPLQLLRQQIGFVSQEIFLFSESVSENIALGINEYISESNSQPLIEEASRLAAVHEDVLGLMDGFGTRLGERGVNLSGGQRQRISIARAIAKEPAILVLDDALSSVDVETENAILKKLRSRPGRNTEVIAAHRISTVRDSDRIVVLVNGRIEEMGPHAALLKKRTGVYRKFYDEQQLKEDFDLYLKTVEVPLGT